MRIGIPVAAERTGFVYQIEVNYARIASLEIAVDGLRASHVKGDASGRKVVVATGIADGMPSMTGLEQPAF